MNGCAERVDKKGRGSGQNLMLTHKQAEVNVLSEVDVVAVVIPYQ